MSVASRPSEERNNLPALAVAADCGFQVADALTGGWAMLAMSLLGVVRNSLLKR